MRTAPDSHPPTHPQTSGAGSAWKSATQCDFAGPYSTGRRMVQIVTRGADGRACAVEYFPAADKAEALAIAERERAVLTG